MTTHATGGALRAVLVLGAAALTGCASLPPPRELDLTRMQVLAVDTPPRLDINGLPGGKAVGVGVGAGTGSGAGVVAGAAACIATGPLFPLCVLTVVPTSAAIGAVAGGIVGGVRTESTEEIERKTKVVRDHLSGSAYQRSLVTQLEEELRDAAAGSADAAAPLAQGQPERLPEWTLEVSVVELGTEGKSRFALRLVARAALRRSGAAAPVWTLAKEVQSESELTTSGWAADDGRAMQVVLDRCVRAAARQLRIDLTRPFDANGARGHPRSRYSTSCNDVPADLQIPQKTS